MRVISLNTWGGALFDALADWLPRADADVLCLQEMTRTSGQTGWTRFADAVRTLPQRADLFDDVRSLLPRHDGLFDASDSGPVVVEGAGRLRQQFGLSLFVDERCSVLTRHARFVHGRFVDHDEWPSDGRPRVAQAVRVADPQGRTTTLVHMHGLRDGAGKQDTPERRAQARKLGELVEATREPGEFTVVCGDLNLLPSSETFGILGDLGLVDLVGDTDTRTSHYPKAVRHASYLLVSDPGAVTRFEVLRKPAVSDHCALVLEY